MIKTTPRYFYLFIFFGACIVFWWSPSIIIFINGYESFLKEETVIISLTAFIFFAFGYLLFKDKYFMVFSYNNSLILKVNAFSKLLTIGFSIPSIVLAIVFYITRSALSYGEGDGVPLIYQAFFYAQLSFFFIYVASSSDEEKKSKTFLFIVFISVLIRLIVSLKWGRFFLIQGVFPVLIIFVARNWIKITFKNILIFLLSGLFVFFVPSYFRGDFDQAKEIVTEIDFDKIDKDSLALDYMKSSSTLKLFQDNKDDDYSKWCNPLIVSLTQKIIPYSVLDICVMDIWREKSLATTLDRILAYKELGPEISQEVLNGPGSNYLLESYVSLGGVVGVCIVSFLLGIITAISFNSLTSVSLFGSIWLEVLTRAVLAPRGNIGYVFERIPMLLITTYGFIILSQLLYRNINAEK